MTRSILRNSILLAVLLYAFTTFLSAQSPTMLYSFAGSDGSGVCRFTRKWLTGTGFYSYHFYSDRGGLTPLFAP